MKYFTFFLLSFLLIGSGCLKNNSSVKGSSTLLPLGDGMRSTSAKQGSLFSCQTQFNGLGAFKAGPWIDLVNKMWDPSLKLTVDGDVAWDGNVSIQIQDDRRLIISNGLPNDHHTGTYPIATTDDAYAYDRNPNRISAQNIELSLPANPSLAASPRCVPNVVAIALSGVPIFNGFDATGNDAVAHEVQDLCGGHPERTSQYHYHNVSDCIDASTVNEHSPLVGYALDGFGLYGPLDQNGKELTNADLDACHGHNHLIEWDDMNKEMYHYHATAEFPYTIGCMMGAEVVNWN